MIGRDVVLADGEEGVGAEPRQLRMAVRDRGPRRLDSSALWEIDFEPLAPQRLTIPGEKTDPDAHGRP